MGFLLMLALFALTGTSFASHEDIITFVNNCESNVALAKYSIQMKGSFECDITEPEDTLIIPPTGVLRIPKWSLIQNFVDDVVPMFTSEGFPITSMTYDDINKTAVFSTCDDDPPKNKLAPVEGLVYLCVMSPPSSPEPSPDNASVIIVNECSHDVVVGNFFEPIYDDNYASYDIRCAPLTTLPYGVSMILPISYNENSYFSLPKGVNVTSAYEQDLVSNGHSIKEFIIPGMLHPECGTIADDLDTVWYSYNIYNDVITICG